MNHRHEARVEWRATQGEPLPARRFSRAHAWHFDGGLTVPASSSPSVVPVPMSDPAAVDPEEALVAALASCHMMSFLHLASRKSLDVASYVDRAEGELGRRADGRTAMLSVALHPQIEFVGEADRALVSELHQQAHELCYIANSVNFPVTVEPLQ